MLLASTNLVLFFSSFELYDNVGSAKSGAVVTSVKYPRTPYFPDWPIMALEESNGGGQQPLSVSGDEETNLLLTVKSYEEFLILSSTKQNIELYKILRTINSEIQSLKTSVDNRMSDLESLIANATTNNDSISGLHQILSVAPKNSSSPQHDKTLKLYTNEVTLGGQDDSLEDTSPMLNGNRFVGKPWPMPPPGGGKENETMELHLMRNRNSDRLVILNVGGKKYEVRNLNNFNISRRGIKFFMGDAQKIK